MYKEIMIPCQYRCSMVTFTKWVDEEEYFISFYPNFIPAKKNLIQRILLAIRNKNHTELGIVCKQKDIDKLKEWL